MIRVSPKLKHWEKYEDNAKFFLIFSFSFRMSRANNEKKKCFGVYRHYVRSMMPKARKLWKLQKLFYSITLVGYDLHPHEGYLMFRIRDYVDCQLNCLWISATCSRNPIFIQSGLKWLVFIKIYCDTCIQACINV